MADVGLRQPQLRRCSREDTLTRYDEEDSQADEVSFQQSTRQSVRILENTLRARHLTLPD